MDPNKYRMIMPENMRTFGSFIKRIPGSVLLEIWALKKQNLISVF